MEGSFVAELKSEIFRKVDKMPGWRTFILLVRLNDIDITFGHMKKEEKLMKNTIKI